MQTARKNASIRPRFGRIWAATAYSGISRSGLYERAPHHPGLFRKNGNATLVDFDILDQSLDDMPLAKPLRPTPSEP
jgi:hypothetical protein